MYVDPQTVDELATIVVVLLPSPIKNMDVRSLLESCGRQAAALNKHCWIFFALLTSYVIKVSILGVVAIWGNCMAFSKDQGSYSNN